MTVQESQSDIHPSAVVESGARLGAGVKIGPFCHVGGNVALGDDVELLSHVSVQGHTTVGRKTRVWPQATLGAQPQNFKHSGKPTELIIGQNCVIREGTTAHVGSDASGGKTIIGDECYLMAYSHVAHDCTVGDHVVMANGAHLAGHCKVGDYVTISGLTAVHQFVRIGHHAFVGGCSALVGDLIPYGTAAGNRAVLRGFNITGMKRSGMARADIVTLRKAYRMLFDRSRAISESALAVRKEFADNAAVVEIVDFLTGRAKRYYCVPKLGVRVDDDGGNEY